MPSTTVLSRTLRAIAALSFLAALAPTSASANLTTNCTIVAGHLVCDGTGTPCADDTSCFANGLGRCISDPAAPDFGFCTEPCQDLFLCSGADDCPAFDGLTNGCHPVPGLPNGAVGVCTYADASDRPVVTVCGGSSTTFFQCFAGGSWADGNCDGDALPNGVDSTPCVSGGTAITPFPSPFCLPLRICEGTSDVCAPALRCTEGTSGCDAVAAQIGATTTWECSTFVADQPTVFCHPACGATARCANDGDCIGRGTCRQAEATLSLCEPDLFRCGGGCVSTDPLDWATADGDCDGDGAANLCDPNPCEGGDEPCMFGACFLPGTDAGVPTDDAGVTDDAGIPESDAGTPSNDAGTSGMDGSASGGDASSIPVTPGLVFGGGGGCRCAAAGASGSTSAARLASVGLALGLLIGARRRRSRATRATLTRR